jgi:hypothetical protein
LLLATVDIEALLRENLHGFSVDFALILVRELLEDELRERCGGRTICGLDGARRDCWRPSADSGGSADTNNSISLKRLSKQLSPGKALILIPGRLKMKTKGILINLQNAPHL